MAVNQEYKEYRVNDLPVTGYAGDRYYLNVGGGKFQTYIISDALTPVREAGQEFIECDTVDDLRNLDARQIWAIQNGYYKGVTLNGYYNANDTPSAIQYYLSDTTEEDDGGSVFEVGGIKLEHEFVGEINTVYFGLNSSMGMTPIQVRNTIQSAIDVAVRRGIKKFIINSGEHISQSPSIVYGISDSVIIFEGSLKLKDNDSTPENLTGCRLIGYTGDNITVINQKIDGNRDNQALDPQKGTQFNFTYYKNGGEGIRFEGGWSINAIQSHCQFTSKQVYFENYLMDTCGEHGVYYSISNDGGIPGALLQMDNCVIRNHAIVGSGSSVTTRAVRKGIYNNCTFDSGTTPKDGGNGQCTHVTAYYAYRGVLLEEGEEFIHTFDNCTFKRSPENIFSVTARADVNTEDPLSIKDHVNLGRGIFITRCVFDDINGSGVVKMENSIIRHEEGNLKTYNWFNLPRQINNCLFYNLYRVVPTEAVDVDWINNSFIDSDYVYSGNRIIFDNNSQTDPSASMTWNFIGNKFINFTTQTTFGIIRNSLPSATNFKLVVDGNELIGCDNAVLAFVGSTPDVVLTNNKDITNSGVRFRFSEDAIPKLVSNNDFIKDGGSLSDRPSGDSRYIGQMYYLTNTNRQQRWNGTSWEIINYPDVATTGNHGLVKKSSLITDVTTSDATDEASAIALANALKFKVNEMLSKLRQADIVST